MPKWPGFARETSSAQQNGDVQRLLRVRITRVEAKFAYVLAFVVLGSLVYRFVPIVGPFLMDALQLAGVWYGSRVFRSFGEAVPPPRAWWRMTAWRTASGWIGALATLGLALVTCGQALALAGSDRFTPYEPAEFISLALFWAIVAFLYLNSWARLRRLGIRKPPPLKAVGKNVLLTPPNLP